MLHKKILRMTRIMVLVITETKGIVAQVIWRMKWKRFGYTDKQ